MHPAFSFLRSTSAVALAVLALTRHFQPSLTLRRRRGADLWRGAAVFLLVWRLRDLPPLAIVPLTAACSGGTGGRPVSTIGGSTLRCQCRLCSQAGRAVARTGSVEAASSAFLNDRPAFNSTRDSDGGCTVTAFSASSFAASSGLVMSGATCPRAARTSARLPHANHLEAHG